MNLGKKEENRGERFIKAFSHFTAEPLSRWIHYNFVLAKIVVISSGVLTTLISLNLIYFDQFLYGFISVLLSLFFFSFNKLIDFTLSSRKEMSDHLFFDNECEGGRLYYEGDIPVLSIETEDPFNSGKMQGMLLGANLNRLMERWKIPFYLSNGMRHPEELPHITGYLKKVIPDKYLKELNGIVIGYNQWLKDRAKTDLITLDVLLLYHLIADRHHFSPAIMEARITGGRMPLIDLPIGSACSVVIHGNKEEGIMIGRNLDWPTMGGLESLIIKRTHSNGKKTVGVGVPGVVGISTGMNSLGLCLATNASIGTTDELRGMPSLFLNRLCLENCNSVDEVERLLGDHPPLGPYHLSIADAERAGCFHMYQNKGNELHFYREWNGVDPLIVSNRNYEKNCSHKESIYFFNDEREENLYNYFKNSAPKSLETMIKQGLSLPLVNNPFTVHHVLMNPRLNELKVAFNDGFAGDLPLKALPRNLLD
ncbi:C45 family autoproteolytic acyltransferase/hydrolase [Chlamydiales bacterium]|nr:C45 family autoproteolytic acyltransferase/hydrolase [Chlamydiales bacterium]